MGILDECYARLDGDELILGNRHVERRWRVREGLLYASSFVDRASGRQWIAREAGEPSLYPPVVMVDEPRTVELVTRQVTDHPVETPSFVAELMVRGTMATLTYEFQIFPAVAGVAMRLRISTPAPASLTARAAPAEATPSIEPTGVEAAPKPSPGHALVPDAIECLILSLPHLRLTRVQLQDQTDHHNTLAFENDWLLFPAQEHLYTSGDVFCIEDVLDGEGLAFVKIAPLPHARVVQTPHDLRLDGDRLALLGHGIGDAAGIGYASALICYQGGRPGRTAALQEFQRQLRPYVSGRDGLLLTNTWGDRSKDGRISESFMTREIEAAARLGADVVEIDDGWERGRTANSIHGGVWLGFWAADERFWEADLSRLPNGLAPLVQQARGRGMQFGLWFGPDSANDFENWERDVEVLVDLHRRVGVNYFKLDGVKIRSKLGETRFGQFCEKVLSRSAGRIVLDPDVTAETRMGYFGLPHAGPVFVENRYTDWRRYYPHSTLRNLWMLTHYVDPLRLRMEFLNNARNADKYGDDPLAPGRYSPAYLFATVMFASPLGWFEVSNLPADYIGEVSKLVALWKRHRDGIFAGPVIPIGDEPSGTSWTGFAAVAPDRRSAHVLAFRELNDQADWTTRLPLLAKGEYRARVIWGNGKCTMRHRELSVRIERPRDFLWLRVSLR